MQKNEIKKCPCCQQYFECKVSDMANCQCQNFVLQKETLDFISLKYKDCLCLNCLLELKNEHNFIEKKVGNPEN